MTGFVTPLALSLLGVAAWGLSLAVISARPELFVAVLPLVLTLASLARRRATPDYSVSQEISATRVFEGDRATVTVTVNARSPLPLIEVLAPMPPGAALVSGKNRTVLTLGAGETTAFRYELGFNVRGVFGLTPIATRVTDGARALGWERRHAASTLVRVYPKISPLRSLPRPTHTQTSIGDYVSPALGEGIEPGDIREFAPGDRIKQVHWRASLRRGRLYVTQRQRERNADVVLMLDTLSEVGIAPFTTLDASVRATAALATAYLARKDRVGLITYGGLLNWVKPASGRVQYERIADTLLRVRVAFTYVTRELILVPPRVLPPRALVIAITPLLDARFTKATLDLAARGFDLAVLVVSPVDVLRTTLRPSPVNALACRLWQLDRRSHLDRLRRHAIAVTEWRPSVPLEDALARLGRRRPRRVPAA
jgi:uncharacterized protein (DUF58 family)